MFKTCDKVIKRPYHSWPKKRPVPCGSKYNPFPCLTIFPLKHTQFPFSNLSRSLQPSPIFCNNGSKCLPIMGILPAVLATIPDPDFNCSSITLLCLLVRH